MPKWRVDPGKSESKYFPLLNNFNNQRRKNHGKKKDVTKTKASKKKYQTRAETKTWFQIQCPTQQNKANHQKRSSTRAGVARGTIISSMTWEHWAGGVKQTRENQPEEERLTQCVI